MEFNGMPVPAELEFDFQMNNWDDQKKESTLNAFYEQNPDKKPQQGSGGQGDDPNAAAAAAAAQNGADPNKPAGQPLDFKALFGDDVENEEVAKTLIKKGREYSQKESEINEIHSVLSRAKDPVPDKYKPVIGFYNAFGIDSPEIATKVTSINKESVKTDPISVIVANKMLNNPEIAEHGWEAVRRVVLKEEGISGDVQDMSLLRDDEKLALSIKAAESFKTVEEKLKSLDNSKDFYTSLQNKFESEKAQVSKNIESWKPHVAKLVTEFSKEITLKVKDDTLGEIDIPVAIGEGMAKELIRNFGQFLATTEPDEKGILQLRSAVIGGAIGNENAAVTLIQNAIPLLKERLQGIILRDVKQQIHAGRDPFISIQANPGGQGNKKAYSANEMLDAHNSGR